MNENRGSVLHDSSGHGFSGHIGKKVLLNGSSHGFRHIASGVYRPGRIDTVPDYSRLDPGEHAFTVKARFKWSYHDHDNNIVQKGQGSPYGGIFKMKTSVPSQGQPRGQLKCLFRGSIGDSQVESYGHRRLDDNKWHTVECSRNGKGTVMRIDGVVVDRNSKQPGVISNNWPIAIAGNTACDSPDLECNYWSGRIDYVKWRVQH